MNRKKGIVAGVLLVVVSSALVLHVVASRPPLTVPRLLGEISMTFRVQLPLGPAPFATVLVVIYENQRVGIPRFFVSFQDSIANFANQHVFGWSLYDSTLVFFLRAWWVDCAGQPFQDGCPIRITLSLEQFELSITTSGTFRIAVGVDVANIVVDGVTYSDLHPQGFGQGDYGVVWDTPESGIVSLFAVLKR